MCSNARRSPRSSERRSHARTAVTATSFPVNASPSRRRWRWARILGAIFLFGTALVAAAILSVITLSRDAARLRSDLRAANPDAEWSTRIQGDVGPVLLGALRLGLGFHHELEPEVRQAVAAVRRASVGVYRLSKEGPGDAVPLVLPEARAGWTRLAAVRHNRERVVIYVRDPGPGTDVLRVALAVQTPDELVVVAGELAPEHLLSLVPARS